MHRNTDGLQWLGVRPGKKQKHKQTKSKRMVWQFQERTPIEHLDDNSANSISYIEVQNGILLISNWVATGSSWYSCNNLIRKKILFVNMDTIAGGSTKAHWSICYGECKDTVSSNMPSANNDAFYILRRKKVRYFPQLKDYRLNGSTLALFISNKALLQKDVETHNALALQNRLSISLKLFNIGQSWII